jgi:hypothetical protein
MRNARREAFERIGGRYEVRVLEPSPPVVDAAPWFADDPVVRGDVPIGRELVSPATKGDLLWSDLFDEYEGLAEWCADRWLGGHKPLAPAPPELDASRVQLWPEHFDLATEFGSETDGERAGYGGSPGDALHVEPYLYVVPWDQTRAEGDGWNSDSFRGAELAYAQLLESDRPRELALDFFRSRMRTLVDPAGQLGSDIA